MPEPIFGNEDFVDPFFPKDFDAFYKDWFVLEDTGEEENGLGRFCLYGREYSIETGAKGKRPAEKKQNAMSKTSEFFKVSMRIGDGGPTQIIGAAESLEQAAKIVHHHCWQTRAHASRVIRAVIPQTERSKAPAEN